MKTASLIQGSPEWLAHRRTVRNASEASVMMGAFPTFSRRELVRLIATGLEREFSDYAQKFILDRGHHVEPALRAFAERLIGEELYPVTGISDDGYLGASFDGVTMDETIILECKQPNAGKVANIENGVIPAADYWQIVHQFAVCETAQRCLYLVGDGGNDTAVMHIERETVESDIPKLLAGWAQFDADVAAYVPEQSAPAPVATPVAGFGALSLRVEGRVLASNLDAFRADAEAFIARLPKPSDLQDDQDFADADAAVKACAEAEARIKAATDAALAQMADVDAVLRAADEVAETIRAARLALDKAVKAEKENRRAAIVQSGVDAVREHYATINATLGEHTIGVPASLRAEIAESIKGKRTLTSIRDSVDAAVANAKIAASQVADKVRANITVLADFADHAHLFADRVALCASKAPDDLRNLVAARVAEHQQREQAKLDAERERIRQEEASKLERARAEAERETDTTQRAIESVQQPSAAGGGRDGSTGELRAAGEPGIGIAKPPTFSGQRLRLGDINAAIAPLTITADGLAQLGFTPVGQERAAKLYAAGDFERVRAALIQRLQSAALPAMEAAA